MWSDNDIDNAFRRLDPAEPEHTPFPLDAWLKLESGLDQAVIDRAVRHRLWQFFAAEVAVVALVGLGWWLWPMSGAVSSGPKTHPVAATVVPRSRTVEAKRQQASGATGAATLATRRGAVGPAPARPQQGNARPAPAATATPLPWAPKDGSRQALAVAGAPVTRFRVSSGRVALGKAPARLAGPVFGRPRTPSPARGAERETRVFSRAGGALAAEAGAGTKAAVQPASSTGTEAGGTGAAGQMVSPAGETSGVAIAGATPPGAGQDSALTTRKAPAATEPARASTTSPNGRAEAVTIAVASAPDAADTGFALATVGAVALERPLIALLPAQLPSAANTPIPLPGAVPQPRFYVGLAAAPDVSTVKFADVRAPHLNVGLTLEYRLGQRWRVATGVQRAAKEYSARREDYDWGNYPRAYTRDFSLVDGSCTVIDVPLNLRYDAVAGTRYRVFGTVGLSSFFMQRERYAYDYYDYTRNTTVVWERSYTNANQHLFSVLNLSAGYEYGLSTHWRLQAEPYLKVPLAGVGVGRVKLLSAGVYFGLKYGF